MRIRAKTPVVLLLAVLAPKICLTAADDLTSQIRLLNDSVANAPPRVHGAGSVACAAAEADRAPGIFVVNSASGLPAALAETFAPNGTQSLQDVYETGPSGSLVAAPIDVTSGQVYLIVFGTGGRGAQTVTATVGSQSVPVPYAGAQGTYAGEDQINIGPLPASLAGSGSVAITLTADGVKANAVYVAIK